MADLNQNSNNFAVVKACFVAGFYPNVCRVDRKLGNLKSKHEKKLLPHVTSVLREKNLKSLKSILTNLPSEWIVFEEKSRVERLCLVRNNTVVSPITIALFGGPMYIPKNNVIVLDDSDSENDESPNVKFILDDWIYFVSDEDVAVMIHQLRIKLNALFMKTLCNMDKKAGSNTNDDRIIDVISSVLETEDNIAGFKCPKDVGVRPILLPLKGSWRDKNRIRKSNVAERFPNGKPSLQNYQSNQQLTYQQRQRTVGPQLNNTHDPTHRFKQNSRIYRKNDGESGGSNSHPHDFDLYVSHFKCQVMLKPTVRYFVLHADSKEIIFESYQNNRKWLYSPHALRQFKTIKNVSLSHLLIIGVSTVCNFCIFIFFSQRVMLILFCSC